MVLTVRDHAVLLPSALVFFFSGALLYQDLNQGSHIDTSKLIEIGSALNVSQTVKRRFQGDLIWNPIEVDEGIYQKDTLQTGAESNLEVKFKDGSTMSLGENSLVVLDMSEEQFSVEVLQGAIAANGAEGAQGLSLKMGDRTIQATGAVGLNIDREGRAELSVGSGTARITINGKEIFLDENQLGTLTNEGVDVKDVPFKRVYPNSPKVFVPKLGQVKKSIPFRWTNLKEVKGLFIQVARDKGFNEIAFSEELSTKLGENESSFNVAPGNYFYRLLSIDSSKKTVVGPLWQLQVEEIPQVTLLSPVPGKTLITSGKEDLEFEWKKVHPDATYEFALYRVSQNPKTKESIKELRFEDKIDYSRLEVEDLEFGSYEWQVRVMLPNLVGRLESPVQKFQVSEIKELPVPSGASPENGTHLAFLKGKSVTLSWRAVSGANSYEVEIRALDENPDLEEPLVVKTELPVYVWEAPSLGKYEWSVKALSLEAKPSQKSITQLVLVNDASIRTISPKEGEEIVWFKNSDQHETEFRWVSPNGKFSKTVLQFSKTKSFEKVLSFKEVESRALEKASFPGEGDWFWRVVSYDEKGKPALASAPSLARVVEKVAPPVLLFPKEQDELSGFFEREVSFKWKSVPGASRYRFKLTLRRAEETGRGISSSAPFLEETVSGVEFKSDQKIPFGTYSWSVTPVDRDGKLGVESEMGTFTLKRKTLPPPVEVFTPEFE